MANGGWQGHHAPGSTMGNSYSPAAAPEPLMYKLSHQADLDFLEKQLQMLCFADYSLYLHFDDGIIIAVEGQFHHKAGKAKTKTYSFPIDTSCLTRLLGTFVQRIEIRNDEDLRLKFSNGDSFDPGRSKRALRSLSNPA